MWHPRWQQVARATRALDRPSQSTPRQQLQRRLAGSATCAGIEKTSVAGWQATGNQATTVAFTSHSLASHGCVRHIGAGWPLASSSSGSGRKFSTSAASASSAPTGPASSAATSAPTDDWDSILPDSAFSPHPFASMPRPPRTAKPATAPAAAAKVEPTPKRKPKSRKLVSPNPIVNESAEELLALRPSIPAPAVPRAPLVAPPPAARPYAQFARLPTWNDDQGRPFVLLMGTDGSSYIASGRAPTWIIGLERRDKGDTSRVFNFRRPRATIDPATTTTTTTAMTEEDAQPSPTETESTTTSATSPPPDEEEDAPVLPVPADLHPQWYVAPQSFWMPTAEAVLLAHGHPRPSPWHLVQRRDRNPENNALENLYWQTPAERVATDLQKLRDAALAAGHTDFRLKKTELGNAFVSSLGHVYSLLTLSLHTGRLLPNGFGARLRARLVYELFTPNPTADEIAATQRAAAAAVGFSSSSLDPLQDVIGFRDGRIQAGWQLTHIDGDVTNCALANLRLAQPGIFFRKTRRARENLLTHIERVKQEIAKIKGELPHEVPLDLPADVQPTPAATAPAGVSNFSTSSVAAASRLATLSPSMVEKLNAAYTHPTAPLNLGPRHNAAREALAREAGVSETDIRRWIMQRRDADAAAAATAVAAAVPPAPSKDHGRPLGPFPIRVLREKLDDPSLPWIFLGKKYRIDPHILKYHARMLTAEAARRGGGIEKAKEVLREREAQMKEESERAGGPSATVAVDADASLHAAIPFGLSSPPVSPELDAALSAHLDRKRAMEVILRAKVADPTRKTSALKAEHDPRDVLELDYVRRLYSRLVSARERGLEVDKFIRHVVDSMLMRYPSATPNMSTQADQTGIDEKATPKAKVKKPRNVLKKAMQVPPSRIR